MGVGTALALGLAGCSSEDQPDVTPQNDAASDAPRDSSSKPDTSTTDGRSDVSTPQPDGGMDVVVRPEGGGGDASDGGTTCQGPPDAALDAATVALGRALVQSLNCARCHQDEPVDAGLILSGKLNVGDSGVYPKNLTPDPQSGLGCWTDQQIANAILNGIDDQGQQLCSRMPKFAGRFDGGGALEGQQIVTFLRSISAVHKDIPDTLVCPPPADGGTDAGDAGVPPADGGDAGDGGTPPVDAGSDVVTPGDGGTDATDAGTVDTGADAGQADGGTDAPTADAAPDVETDAGDAGTD